MDAQELRTGLAHCTGTQGYTRHGLVRSFLMTDGAKFFMENAGGGAYWLMDILCSEPAIKELARKKGIAFVKLNVVGTKALLTVTEDSDIPPVLSRVINFTDCPEGVWDLYLQFAEIDGPGQIVCMVPSEY